MEKHLNDCGLSPEFGTHYRMGALSGGQKVKGESSSHDLVSTVNIYIYLW